MYRSCIGQGRSAWCTKAELSDHADSERMFPLTQFVPAAGRIVPRSSGGSVKNIVRYISFQGDNGEVGMNDVRFALRQHFKHSGFFVAAVLMLALGIGTTTSLFSAVYGVLIDPYPYAKPGAIWTPGLRSATANQRMRSEERRVGKECRSRWS